MKISFEKIGLIFLSFGIILSFAACPRKSKSSEPLKTLRINYSMKQEMAGPGGSQNMETQEILSLDLEKNLMHKETSMQMKMGTTEVKTTSIEFYDGKKHYKMISPDPKKFSYREMNYEYSQPWISPMLPLSESPPKKKFLGRECDVMINEHQDMYMERWAWNGIELKMISKTNDVSLVKEAVNIEENIKLDSSLFELPAGVEAVSQLEIRKEFFERTNKLKNKPPLPFETAKFIFRIHQESYFNNSKTITKKQEIIFIDAPTSKMRQVTITPPVRKGGEDYRTFVIYANERSYRWNSRDLKEVGYRENFNLEPWAAYSIEKNFVKEEKILGRTCRLYESKSTAFTSRAWVWAGIELKSELISDTGVTKKTVVEINEGIKISPKLFEPPASAALVHQDELRNRALKKAEEIRQEAAQKNK